MRNFKIGILGSMLIAAIAVGSGAIDIRTTANLITGNLSVSGTVTGATGKFDVIDAGVVNIEGQLGVAGSIVARGAGTALDATNCVTGQYCLRLPNSTGLFMSSSDTVSNFNTGNTAIWRGRGTGFDSVIAYLNNNRLMDTATAPTVTACSGGTAATVTAQNGSAAFQVDVGTSCAGESTMSVTLPAATTGWVCSCSSTTADRILQQKAASSTTVAVLTNVVISTGAAGDFTDGADLFCGCRGY